MNDVEEEIKALPKAEEKKILSVFSNLAMGFQIGLNSLQRQALHNLTTAALHPDKKFAINFSSLTGGLSARLLSQGLVSYPCLRIRKHLEEEAKQPRFVITLATSLVDTVIGVPLEVYGSLKTLKTLGIDISKKDLLMISSKSFIPFFLRNGIAWAAINDNSQDNLFTKAWKAAIAGAVSTVPHNMGMKAIEYSASGKSVSEVASLVAQDVKLNPSIFLRGAGFRTAATIGSTFCLWSKFTQILEDGERKVFGAEKPSPSIVAPSSQKVVDSKKDHQR